MRIAIFCGAVGHGGSQNTTVSLARELQHRGHEILLCIDRRRFRAHTDLATFDIRDFPIGRFCPAALGSVSMANVIRCRSLLKHLEPDSVLSVSTGPLPVLLAATLLRPVSMVYYEVGPKMRRISRLFSGKVVANSEETRDRLSQWLRKDTAQIPVVRARIDLSNFHYAPSPFERGERSSVLILMMSRLELEKTAALTKVMGAVELLAAQGLPVRLRICGSGRDEKQIASLAAEINGQRGKTIVEIVPARADVAAMIRESDIAIGVGRCAWEAMACGRPAVVIGQEGLGGVVSKETLKTLMYHNFTARGSGRGEEPAEIAATLKPLIESAEYRQELGRFGRAIIEQHYDAALGAKQMEAILREAAQGASGDGLLQRIASCGRLFAVWSLLYAKGIAMWVLKPRVAADSLRSVKMLTA